MDRLFTGTVLLLVTGALIGSTRLEDLNVRLETKSTEVCEGDSVTINCTFEPAGKYKVSWHFNQMPNLTCDSDRIPEKKGFYFEINEAWSTLNISSFKTNDSGWYYCRIIKDIPFLEKKCSTGILVLVVPYRTEQPNPDQTQNLTQNPTQNPTTSDSPTTCLISTSAPAPSPGSPRSDQWWIWLALAVGCVVLVVAIVVMCILNRQKTEIIYENTKPDESGCWRRKQNQMDSCNLPSSKKTDTIKPLRKYDTLSSKRKCRP